MRILAIDYGEKRTGLAVTDNLQIIATALETIPTPNLLSYIEKYQQEEQIEAFVLGLPKKLDGSSAAILPKIEALAQQLQQKFANIPIHWIDERFTSKIAYQTLSQANLRKKDKHKKENIDKISAVLILQTFLEQRK